MPKSSKTPGLGRRTPPAAVLFGTPEEINARNRDLHPATPSTFRQNPADLRGRNANAELGKPKGSQTQGRSGI